jgi:hypothetical protein
MASHAAFAHAAMKFSQKEEAWKMLGGCIGTRGAVAVG